ncbi:MAG: helix-turn-helix transcriptional regulator [Conexivisphaera sp.]
MDRLGTFLVILVSASVGLGITIVMLAALTTGSYNILGLVVQLLMGRAPAGIPFFMPLTFLMFLAMTLAGSVGVIYFIVMPEIARGRGGSELEVEDMMRFLLPDERRIVQILVEHGGEYLQKSISREAGFTRLRTHRAIARLAQRGIVSVERSGNTNLVRLAVAAGRGSGDPGDDGQQNRVKTK